MIPSMVDFRIRNETNGRSQIQPIEFMCSSLSSLFRTSYPECFRGWGRGASHHGKNATHFDGQSDGNRMAAILS